MREYDFRNEVKLKQLPRYYGPYSSGKRFHCTRDPRFLSESEMSSGLRRLLLIPTPCTDSCSSRSL